MAKRKATKNTRTRMIGFHTDPDTAVKLEQEAATAGRSTSAHLDALLRQRYGNPKIDSQKAMAK